MGWKNFKKAFSVEHIVHVKDDLLYIGSSFISELAAIDMKTGAIINNHKIDSDFLRSNYPAIVEATNKDRLKLITSKDEFSQSLPVFKYDGAKLIEKKCEVYEYPNTTHDGELMFRNEHFSNPKDALDKAIKSTNSYIAGVKGAIKNTEGHLAALKKDLRKAIKHNQELKTRSSRGKKLKKKLGPEDNFVKCASCNSRHKIKNLTFIQAHFYVRPFGCTGGDYWNSCKSDSGYKCLKCGVRNRLLPEWVYNLRHKFKELVDEHKENINEPWVNSKMK